MMKQSTIWLLCFLAGVMPALRAAPRDWTDVTGRKITAEFVAVAEGTVTLMVNGKEYKLPIAKLSPPDQIYLESLANPPRVEPPVEPVPEPPAPATASSGEVVARKVEITQRAFPDANGYYSGRFGKLLREYQSKNTGKPDAKGNRSGLNEVSAVVWSKSDGVGTGTMLMHVPANYDGTEAFGVLVFVSSGPSGVNLRKDWDKVFAEKKLIYCSPFGAGNEQEEMRRTALALDAVATVRQDFKIDPNRLFISGVSGGGAMATIVGVNFAEFKAIDCARGSSPTPQFFPYLGQREFREIAKQKKRFAWVSGPKDSNYESIQRGVLNWSAANVKAKLFEHPEQGHSPGTADLMRQAITWIEDAPGK